MGIFVNRIGGNYYKLQVDTGGDIILDVGTTGKVTIDGDLDVLGEQTSVGSTQLVVDDNTITVNNGETGNGITLGTAGLIMDRGTDDDAHFFFDESLVGKGAEIDGAFVTRIATGDLVSLYTNAILTNGEPLYLVGTGTGLATVTGTTDYEKQIWNYTGDNINLEPLNPDGLVAPNDDDALLNVKGLQDYVRDYFAINFQEKITTGTLTPTRVEAFDTETGGVTSRVEISVDDTIIATFYETRVEFENLRFDDDTITSNGINGDVVLRAAGTGFIKMDDYTNYTIQTDPASPPTEGTLLYSKTLGDGGTGLYFVNEDGTSDELVSRNKALLYSIIF